MVLSDDVIRADVPFLRQLLNVYERTGYPVVALMRVPLAEISAYGAVKAEVVPDEGGNEVYRVDDLVEKPRPETAPSNLAIIGRSILTPDIFERLEEVVPGNRGESQLTDALRSLLRERPIYGVCFQGTRYDAGSKLGFLKARVESAQRRDDMGAAFRQYLQELTAGWQTGDRTGG